MLPPPFPVPLEPVPLETRCLGHPLWFLPEVDSTNQQMRERAAAGATEGSVLLSDFQRAGRGRAARGWDAPPGSALLFSVLLRPVALDERHALLPLAVGVAVARTLEEHLHLRPTLKWPNDVLLGGRKCCGILVESDPALPGGPALVLGIGLNVNQDDALRATLPHATSLRLETGHAVERGPLLAALLRHLERAYEALQAGATPHAAWRRRAPMLGQLVDIYPAGAAPFAARALDVARDGGLIVQQPDGHRQTFHAADVSVRPLSEQE